MPAFQFIAVLAATLFAGAAIYISVGEHPARMECGTVVAATVFGPSYRRAAVMQALLALVAAVSGVGAWFAGSGMAWLIGAVLIFAVVRFTLVVIMPTNKKLLDPSIEPAIPAPGRYQPRIARSCSEVSACQAAATAPSCQSGSEYGAVAADPISSRFSTFDNCARRAGGALA
jgi:hypothetical protein